MFRRNKKISMVRSTSDIYYSTSTITNISSISSTSTSTTTSVSVNYVSLQNDVGEEINTILETVIEGSNDLTDVLSDDNYSNIVNKLNNYTNTGTDNTSKTFEEYRKLLVYSLEAVKQADIRQKEQLAAYEELQAKYNAVLNPAYPKAFMEVSADLNTSGVPKPEIVEYVKRGYSLIDEYGFLVPLDLVVIDQIKIDLNL